MKEKYRFIFDLDGTLYQFDKGATTNFASSTFYQDLKDETYKFFMSEFNLTYEEASSEYERIKTKYLGEVSLGLEKERGLDRYKYFEATWNLHPSKYIKKDAKLPKLLKSFTNRAVLLTSAPRVWSNKVLAYLAIEKIFGNSIYTGEPNLRKPNPLLFQKIANDLNSNPISIVSIGDQEETDILPAKSIGMKTLRIGKNVKTSADYSAENLAEAIQILSKEGFL